MIYKYFFFRYPQVVLPFFLLFVACCGISQMQRPKLQPRCTRFSKPD